MSDSVLCPCGVDHAVSRSTAYARVRDVVRDLGPTVNVTVDGVGAWRVPRVWIGMHGLKAVDLPALAARYGWEPV